MLRACRVGGTAFCGRRRGAGPSPARWSIMCVSASSRRLAAAAAANRRRRLMGAPAGRVPGSLNTCRYDKKFASVLEEVAVAFALSYVALLELIAYQIKCPSGVAPFGIGLI